MKERIRNIHSSPWEDRTSPEGSPWQLLELSGHRLGAHLEILPPGSHSSVHHYHTAEEEHVLVLDGTATLVLDEEQVELVEGDHVWFEAGDCRAHHIENRSSAPFKFLVYGERNLQDVVVYPEKQVMLLKTLDRKLFTYRPYEREEGKG